MKSFLFPIIFLLVTLNSQAAIQNPTDQELSSMIDEAKGLYGSKYQVVKGQVSELFGIDISEYKRAHQSEINQLNLKISLIEKIEDSKERERRLQMLEKEYEDSDLFQYLEAYYYLQNEMAKDHLFVGRYLSTLEKLTELLIQKDPIFQYAFLSKEARARQGLILTRVVWQIGIAHNVCIVTEPLNLHSVFANKAKIPMLIRITPFAFHSLAYIRSLLLHELNHVYMYRDPVFSDAKRFGGKAIARAKGRFTHYFKSLNPISPSYQYHLIHEYYSFKSQLMFDEIIEDDPFYRLDPTNRKNIKQMFDWTYSQLNKANKKFVDANPIPPVFKLIQRFYPSNPPFVSPTKMNYMSK